MKWKKVEIKLKVITTDMRWKIDKIFKKFEKTENVKATVSSIHCSRVRLTENNVIVTESVADNPYLPNNPYLLNKFYFNNEVHF